MAEKPPAAVKPSQNLWLTDRRQAGQAALGTGIRCRVADGHTSSNKCRNSFAKIRFFANHLTLRIVCTAAHFKEQKVQAISFPLLPQLPRHPLTTPGLLLGTFFARKSKECCLPSVSFCLKHTHMFKHMGTYLHYILFSVPYFIVLNNWKLHHINI